MLNINENGPSKRFVAHYDRHWICRDVGDGWAGLAIAHPVFGRSVNRYINQRGQIVSPTLLLAHPALGTILHP